jgi:hypothetical protein
MISKGKLAQARKRELERLVSAFHLPWWELTLVGVLWVCTCVFLLKCALSRSREQSQPTT